MQDFRELKVWKQAHQLVLDVYRDTKSFPTDERYGLTSQLRRSVVSISSNIAEGTGRGTSKDFARFVDLALGSTNETECQLLLARDLGFVGSDTVDQLLAQLEEVRRMATSLSRTLKQTARGNCADPK